MALILCPECGREVSDRAKSCPGCGCPVELKLGYPKCAFFTNKRKAIVEMENGRMRFTLNDEVIADDYLCHYTLVFICDKYEYDFHLYIDGNPKMISIYLKYSEQKYYDYLVRVFTNFCKVDMVANFADATTYFPE